VEGNQAHPKFLNGGIREYMVEETKTEVGHFEIEVNRVKFRENFEDRTGLQIKEDAIAAGVKIKRSYVLDLETEGGTVRIPDDKVVEIHSGEKFLAHPGGSDS
jgi:hypothetical protein